ncbi:helix-turn-helix domain-containing protein [Streptomyces litchfieldiae]|uniref:Helix-turn-helix transcriptional regulator n=1 Tax=Streptomyces litchfieldiae TaxID=3075543 RepID=A0ABU2MQR7_9ACTN|nr:helix-turn-helix transcriptional regulator [Streptomyces sp. DSM 44938]MDT0343885.1 helix-turn-helix transcriptional regulator [Streptomyces sp. DSM 44938]
MSRARSGATTALRLLAADLRIRREAAGMSIAAAAEKLDVHPTTIRRLEAARHTLKPATVAHLLTLYGTAPEEVARILTALSQANQPGWWHEFRDLLTPEQSDILDFESSAGLIRSYAPALVPDLLQTEGYARVLLRRHHPQDDAATLDRRIALLAARRRAAFERERPLRLWVLIEEAALHRPIGDPGVMREQIAYLDALAADRSSTRTVQVMPLDAPTHPMLASGTVHVMRFEHPYLADRLVVSGLHQVAATITDDIGAVRQYARALDLACMAAPEPHTPVPTGPSLTQGDEQQ